MRSDKFEIRNPKSEIELWQTFSITAPAAERLRQHVFTCVRARATIIVNKREFELVFS